MLLQHLILIVIDKKTGLSGNKLQNGGFVYGIYENDLNKSKHIPFYVTTEFSGSFKTTDIDGLENCNSGSRSLDKFMEGS